MPDLNLHRKYNKQRVRVIGPLDGSRSFIGMTGTIYSEYLSPPPREQQEYDFTIVFDKYCRGLHIGRGRTSDERCFHLYASDLADGVVLLSNRKSISKFTKWSKSIDQHV